MSALYAVGFVAAFFVAALSAQSAWWWARGRWRNRRSVRDARAEARRRSAAAFEWFVRNTGPSRIP